MLLGPTFVEGCRRKSNRCMYEHEATDKVQDTKQSVSDVQRLMYEQAEVGVCGYCRRKGLRLRDSAYLHEILWESFFVLRIPLAEHHDVDSPGQNSS